MKIIIYFFFFFCLICNCSENLNNSSPKKDEITFSDTLINIKDNLSSSKTIVKRNNFLNIKEVFFASPIIYSILLIMSITAFVIFTHIIFTFKVRDLLSTKTINDLKDFLLHEKYEDALSYCDCTNNLLSTMIAAGICTRRHGVQYMLDTIKSEGKRATSKFWQKINILNDIVIIAPMLGLLGTVIGMFYAFYDINRSIDSLSALFDGLGIAVGTTVVGLIVAILSMIFYSILKFKMMKSLTIVENEAVSLGNLIKTQI